MINRYEMKEISDIWSDQHKFEIMLDIEKKLLLTHPKIKNIDGQMYCGLEKVKINIDRINEIEKTVKHDVIAFTTSIVEQLDPQIGKYFHYGVTSSDILDTTLNIQIEESLGKICIAHDKLLSTLFNRCLEWKDVLCMGRTHGKNAEPMSLGVKFLSFYCELSRRYKEYFDFRNKSLNCQFSGAVGNYTCFSPERELEVADELEMSVEPHSTQIINRDYIAKLMSIGSLLASAIERLLTEIRLLHHEDVSEVFESFSVGQKGSSIMPHKKNPISSENITGICRVIKSHFQIASDNINLWHERDISHSSAERLFLPDHFGLILYSFEKLNTLLQNLEIDKESMTAKVLNNDSYLSSYYLHDMLLNTTLTREQIYDIIQQASFSGQYLSSFINEKLDHLDADYYVDSIGCQADIEKIYLKHTQAIFDRVLKEYPNHSS